MSDSITCPTCEQEFSTQGLSPGKDAPCPLCGAVTYIHYPTTVAFLVNELKTLAGLGLLELQIALAETIKNLYLERKHLKKEVWMPVNDPRFASTYSASTWGRIRYEDRKPLRPHVQDGYLRVVLSAGELKQTYMVHVLVWDTFKGSVPADKQIDHIDGIKSNPAIGNLRLLPAGGPDGNQAKRHELRQK